MNVNEMFYVTNVLCYRAFEKILALLSITRKYSRILHLKIAFEIFYVH